MKVALKAGAELDLLSKDELASELRSWSTELTRGAKFRLVDGYADTTAGGVLELPAAKSGPLGPAESAAWGVRRISVTGGADADVVDMYVNEATPSRHVFSFVFVGAVPVTEKFGTGILVLNPGDRLVFTGSSLPASTRITVSGQVKEVPALMAWSL